VGGGRWHLAGFYLNAEYVADGAPSPSSVISKKVADLHALGSLLGPSYKSLSPAAQKKRLIKEHLYLRWRVQPSDVLPLREPVPIPASVYSGRNYHIATPTDISHALFERLLVLGKKNIPEL
jgi:hypothetical protein